MTQFIFDQPAGERWNVFRLFYWTSRKEYWILNTPQSV